MEEFKYIEKGEDGFQIVISEELQQKIGSMAWGWRGKATRIITDEGECYVYNFYMAWLLIGDRLPQMDLPTFDRSRLLKAYFKGFQQGLSEFQGKYSSKYVPGNDAFIANLKSIYEGGLNRVGLKFYRNSIPAIYKKIGLELTGKDCGKLYGLEVLAMDYPVDFKDFFNENKKSTQVSHLDFFNPEIEIQISSAIKEKFKYYDGKKLAIVIYLLNKAFNVINISLNSTTINRINFVRYLKDIKNPKMQAINKYFDHDENLTINDSDSDYSLIKKEIENILS